MRKRLLKLASAMLTSMLAAVSLSAAVVWAASAVQIEVTQSEYEPGDTIVIDGTSPAGQDITLKVVYSGAVVYIDAIPAADNDGSFSFSFSLTKTGRYTIVAGYGSEHVDVAIVDIENDTGGSGGGGGDPTPPVQQTPLVTIGAAVDTTMAQLNQLGPDATDAQIKGVIADAVANVQASLTLASGIGDNAQRAEAYQRLQSMVRQLGEAALNIDDASEALDSMQAVFQSFGDVLDSAEASGVDASELPQTAVTLANALLEKTGTIDASQLATSSGDIDVAALPDGLLSGYVDSVLGAKDRLASTLQEQRLASNDAELQAAITIDLADKTNVDLSLPGSDLGALKTNGIGLAVKTEEVVVSFESDAIPDLEEDADTLTLEVRSPDNEQDIANQKHDFASYVSAPIKDITLASENGNGESSPKGDAFKGKIGFIVDATRVDADKLSGYYYNEQTRSWEIVGGKYDATDKVVEFAPGHLSIYTVVEIHKTFADIAGRWSQRTIEVAFAKGIVKGKTDDAFDPTANVTRAEFASMLVNTLGLTASGGSVFSDVGDDAWYADEVTAAYEAGLVSGMDRHRFAPNDNITREQMAAMIGRALSLYTSAAPPTAADPELLANYTDGDSVSAWASEWISLVVEEGLMTGVTATTLAPADNATREQAATMMLKLFNYE